MPFIELHARSAFSFLEGASVPEDMVAAAADLGMPALAILDRNGVYGSPRFHMAAKKAGIRAHIGAEITATDGNRYPLLCATRDGYRNLCRLITDMKAGVPKGEGKIAIEAFEGRTQGLIALPGLETVESVPGVLSVLARLFTSGDVAVGVQRHRRRDQERRPRTGARAHAG